MKNLGKSISSISYVQNLSWNNNIDMPETDFLKKKYLKDIEIEKKIYSNCKMSLNKKRIDVLNEIKILLKKKI